MHKENTVNLSPITPNTVVVTKGIKSLGKKKLVKEIQAGKGSVITAVSDSFSSEF